jgi:hypothetical protein
MITYFFSVALVTEFGDFVWLDVELILLLSYGMILSSWDAAIATVKL